MQYFAYPEYTSAPLTPVVPGSTLAGEELRRVRVHAVAREDDGTMLMQTVCGGPAHFDPAQLGMTPWDEVDPNTRCLKCQAEIGS